MMHIKPPAVAGFFYPDSAQVLRDTVQGFVRDAHAESTERPRALIAPHAGYQYSGPIAASAYATLAPWADGIRRVAVLAPSHRVPFRGIATSSADLFRTPLGDIAVDRVAVNRLQEMPAVHMLDAAFAEEHALEVQLPFLQAVLPDFTLVPLIVGEAHQAPRPLGLEDGQARVLTRRVDAGHRPAADGCAAMIRPADRIIAAPCSS